MKPYRLEVTEDHPKAWVWRLVTSHGGTLKAQSPQSYTSKINCVRAIDRALNLDLVELPAQGSRGGGAKWDR